MRKVTLAATQMACGDDVEDNIARAEKLIRPNLVVKGAHQQLDHWIIDTGALDDLHGNLSTSFGRRRSASPVRRT